MRASILVVDDDAAVRNVLGLFLSREGYDVAEAEDGWAGLKAAAAERFDLVVADVFMPGLSGVDMVRDILRIQPGIQVVMVSGYDDGLERYGVQLVKPVRPAELLAVVRRLLGEG